MPYPSTRIGIFLLIILFSRAAFITPAYSASNENDGKPDPVNKPVARLSPEIPIQSDADEKPVGWFGKYKWWLALGVTVVAGSVAAALGSGGGDSGETGGGERDSPTEYRTNW